MPYDIFGSPYDRHQRRIEERADRQTLLFLVGLFVGLVIGALVL